MKINLGKPINMMCWYTLRLNVQSLGGSRTEHICAILSSGELVGIYSGALQLDMQRLRGLEDETQSW